MKKKVKKKFNFVKFLVFIIIIVILILGIKYLFDARIKNIVVLNNNYYTDEEIIEACGIENYPKFLTLNKNKLEKKFESLLFKIFLFGYFKSTVFLFVIVTPIVPNFHFCDNDYEKVRQ